MFTGLSSPARREIIKAALMKGAISREESFNVSKLKKSTIYEHFRNLVDAGLLEPDPTSNRKFSVPKDKETVLKLLLFPKSNVEYLDLNMSTWRILEHQNQFVSIVDEIMANLKSDDPVYNITTIYGLIRMYKHERETNYFSNMREKGIDLKMLVPITAANAYQCDYMKDIIEIRHLNDEKLGLKLSLQGKKNVFVWFMEQEENLTIEKDEMVLWLNGSIFHDAYMTVFDYFWRKSQPYAERVKVLNVI